MWFDELMDHFKNGIRCTNENKVIFIPILLKLVLGIIMVIPIIIFATIFLVGTREKIASIFNGGQNYLSIIIPLIIVVSMVIIIYSALQSLIQVGTLNMYKYAIEGNKPTSATFFEGISKYFVRAWGVNLLVYFLSILLSIPLIALALLYSLTIGILTAGWGIVFGFAIIGVYFGAWIIAIVVEDKSIFDGLSASFSLGRKYFWGLFILFLSTSMINKYVVGALGGMVTLIAGWFIAGVIMTYSKMILISIYRDKCKI